MDEPRAIMIYLAGPIDDIGIAERLGWREEMVHEAPENVVFFSPAHAFLGVHKAAFKAMEYLNRHAILCSDGLLANLSGEGKGFGTIREIEFAKSNSKPVSIAQDPADPIQSWLTYDVQIRNSLGGAFDSLLDQIRQTRDAPPFLALPGGIMFRPAQEEPDEGDES